MTVCLRNNLKEYDTRSGIGNVLGRSYQFSFFIKSKVKDKKWNSIIATLQFLQFNIAPQRYC